MFRYCPEPRHAVKAGRAFPSRTVKTELQSSSCLSSDRHASERRRQQKNDARLRPARTRVIRRVLLVDDHEPWRRQIALMLETGSPRWQVVGQAADGLDAVEKARTLRPDLILLDIGLPALNGIEAAARILTHDPASRILFVSEHSASDIVDAALATGAGGYLVKSKASLELRPAMAAVAEGGRFVSASVVNANWRHAAAFYPDDALLLDDYVRLAMTTLKAGNALIVTLERARRGLLEQRLQARGIVIDHAIREGRYLAADVPDALAGFMVDDWPDRERFRVVLISADPKIRELASRPRVVEVLPKPFALERLLEAARKHA